MSSYEIIIMALSCAFLWVEVLRFGVTKPFSCVKCMSGWIGLIIGVQQFGWHGIIYLPVCLFFGAMYEAIKMRWL